MKYTLNLIKENKFYYTLVFIFLLCSSFFLISYFKFNSSISLINTFPFWKNVFFVNYTFFGDGFFSIALCGILAYKKQYKLAICILFSFLSAGVFTQILKNIISIGSPKIYFEASQYLFKLDNFGNSGGGNASFPSSHTSFAFSIATVLSVYFRKNLVSIILFFAALVVGYSRIYLADNSPIDIIIGSFIGITFSTMSLVFLKNEIKFYIPKFNNNKLLKHTI